MTGLEIRVIAYAVLGLILMGGAGWGAHKLTAMHYEAIISKDKIAQDAALQTAQQAVIDAQGRQKAAEDKAEKDHETLVQADTASRTAILGSVRSLEAALHLGSLPAAMDHPGQPGGAGTVTPSADGLAELVDRLNASIEKAVGACQHDATELTGILEVAPQP